MPASSKVVFDLKTLQKNALVSIEERIQIQEQEITDLLDQSENESRISDWRDNQEAKLSEVFSRLGGKDISDEELSRFRLDPMPEFDERELRRAESRLRELVSLKSKVIAKSGSLAADSNGNISLTKTQLSEFFGL